MNATTPPKNNNIHLVCSDCGCEIDASPGGCAYIIDGMGFHHADPKDCEKALEAKEDDSAAIP